MSVRCQCLSLIGHLTQGLEHSLIWEGHGSKGGVQGLLASFSEDSDPRVRTSALQALVSEGCIERSSNSSSSGLYLSVKVFSFQQTN